MSDNISFIIHIWINTYLEKFLCLEELSHKTIFILAVLIFVFRNGYCNTKAIDIMNRSFASIQTFEANPRNPS
jgi:hypothetical protein